MPRIPTGAKINGQHAGTIGDVGCFSFYPSKIITCGEGGMLTTNNPKIASFARSYQNRGRDMNAREEIYINPGRNVRMQNLVRYLVQIQLKKLNLYLKQRRKIAKFYINKLKDCKKIFLVVPKKLENSSF